MVVEVVVVNDSGGCLLVLWYKTASPNTSTSTTGAGTTDTAADMSLHRSSGAVCGKM